MIRQPLCNFLVRWQLSNRQIESWVASWQRFLKICQSKGHVEYVGGDIKERKDNLAANKIAHFSDN